MNLIIKIAVTTVLLNVVPLLSIAQYFQKFYDISATQDGGWNILLNNDGSFFIEGNFFSNTTDKPALFTIDLSPGGDTIFAQHIVQYDTESLYSGNSGQAKKLPGGGFLLPFSEQINSTMSYWRGWAGLIKYNSLGDTVFVKTYTDTSTLFDVMLTCEIMPDGGYTVGGVRSHNIPSYPTPGFIVRTDSMGDTLWTHTYSKYDSQTVTINSIISLPNGRIIVDASSQHLVYAGPPHYFGYYDYSPWFMLLDAQGNIIRDTIYNVGFQGGCFIYNDMNGGYFTIGSFDSMYNNDPTTIENFPSYIAHLDTNFRTTWITSFPYSIDTGHREKFLARQLHDGSYIILGDNSRLGGNLAWAAKVDKNGNVIWNQFYQSDTINDSHFRDMIEKPDGNLIFIGESYNDTLPVWHNSEDVWLVGVDSNGCKNAFCAPTSVKPSPVYKGGEALHVWPNPNNGSFTINVSSAENEPAQLTITNIVGQKIRELTTTTNKDVEVQMSVPKGMYFITAITVQGSRSEKVVLE